MRFPAALLATVAALLAVAPSAGAALPQQNGTVDLLNQAYAQWDGPSLNANAGTGMAAIGDFNGDGNGDFAVGAPGAAATFGGNGAVFVVYGPVEPGAKGLADLGSGGLRINGDNDGTLIGGFVGRAGDVNGDGLDDVVFASAATGANPYQRAWVVFGRRSGGSLDLPALGNGGYRVDCGSCAIESATGIGDVNGDGRSDLAFGVPADDRVYVLHGKASAGAVDAATGAAYELQGVAGTAAGAALDGAGDVNGDGRGDLVVGAPGTAAGPGSAYVVFGRGDTTDINLSPATLGPNGYAIAGEAGTGNAGSAVGGGGDANNDGRPDVVIGARERASGAGAAYVVFGKPGTDPVELTGTSLGSGGFKIQGGPAAAKLGTSVAIVGDVTGDGFADVAASAPQADTVRTNGGAVYVVRGKADGAPVVVGGPPESFGYRVDGAATNHYLGQERAGQSTADTIAGGDVNGDGRSDLLTASIVASSNGLANSGSAYAVLGFGTPAAAYDGLSVRVGTPVTHGPKSVQRTGQATFSISPPLPTGLTLDRATGVISGTPTMASPGREYTVTISDEAGSAGAPLRIEITGLPALPACTNSIRGTNRGNTLRGTPFGDRISGLRGNDKLFGNAGDDCLAGGKGNDRLSGSSGKDKLKGDSGNDTLIGAAGNDSLTGGSGKDRANGGLGKDTYTMGSGNDVVTSADGVAERVNCGAGRDRVTAADRGDRLRGCERARRN